MRLFAQPLALLSVFASTSLICSTVRAEGDASSLGNVASAQAAGLIKSVANAFKGGEVGAAAQSRLIELCGQTTFVLAIIFISYVIASSIARHIGGVVARKVDATLGKFLTKAVRNLIMAVVVMVALQVVLEVDIAGFAAVLAAAGFAIGLALQGTLSNFAAGIMLLVFRPFKVDDYIVIAGTEGTVEEIDLFTTRLNALDNRHLIIPNGEIFGAKLENYSRNEARRVDVNVGTAYAADLKQTRQALERAVLAVHEQFVADEVVKPKKGKPRIKAEATLPQVFLDELGASSVNWQLRVWTHPKNYWAVREALTAAAKNSLDQAGVSIPFPQMDVHVVGTVMAKSRAA